MTGLEPISDRLLDQRRAMRGVWDAVSNSWRDQKAIDFREQIVLPLDERLERVHTELGRLIAAIDSAQRDLG